MPKKAIQPEAEESYPARSELSTVGEGRKLHPIQSYLWVRGGKLQPVDPATNPN